MNCFALHYISKPAKMRECSHVTCELSKPPSDKDPIRLTHENTSSAKSGNSGAESDGHIQPQSTSSKANCDADIVPVEKELVFS